MAVVRKRIGGATYLYSVYQGEWRYLGKEKPIEEWLNKIHCGNAFELLPFMPSESVDCVITSPPYYGLRTYGVETIFGGNPSCEHEWSDRICVKCNATKGELGLEPSWRMYVDHLVELFREVKRVLKKTGSLWLNIGDTYFGGGHGGNTFYELPSGEKVKSIKQGRSRNYVPSMHWKDDVYQPKCLIGVPWRVAFALIEDGWILRNAVIWFKPNAMPSSVKDRLTQTYEYLFHFVKSRRYYYNLDAIREPHSPKAIERAIREMKKGLHTKIRDNKWIAARAAGLVKDPLQNLHGKSYADTYFAKLSKHEQAVNRIGNFAYTDPLHTKEYHPLGKNPGDVFTVPRRSKFLEADVETDSPAARALKTVLSGKLTTKVKKKILDVGAYLKAKLRESGLSFKELSELTGVKQTTLEHYFRTDFSGQALPDRETWGVLKPILKLGEYDDFISEEIRSALPQPHPLGRNPGDFFSIATRPYPEAHFAVFPPELPLRPILASSPPDGVVLDPLAGSGTVAFTCELINHGEWGYFRLYVNEKAKSVKWNLKWILIEINPKYCDLAKKRLEPYVAQKSLLEFA